MFKTMKIMTLGFFLLVSSNAFAVEGKKESQFLAKMEKQLNKTQAEVLDSLAESSDEELMEEYGDIILEMIFADSPVVNLTGMNVEKGIRANVELLYSDLAKNHLLETAEQKIEELGSLKAFNKAVKNAEKNMKSKNKGIGRFFVVVASIFAFPFFIIFGPWGWMYWSVLFGYWS